MAIRQIPNLPAAVFLSPTAQIEIVQDGSTFRASASQIAKLANSQIDIQNDTTDTNSWFPIFAKQNTGKATTLYTSDPKYKYLCSEGRLSVLRPEAVEGIVYNNSTVSLDYESPVGDNATSCGPLTLTAAITIPTGSEWMIL